MTNTFHNKHCLADLRKVGKAQFLRRWCLVATILASVGCGDNREADTPAKPQAVIAKVDAVTMPPGALAEALSGYLDRLVNQVDRAGRDIIALDNSNESKRRVLRWRMLTEGTVLSAIRHKNSMLALVETWAWVISMERYFTQGAGKEAFNAQQDIAITTSSKLKISGEQLVVAVMGTKKMEKLREEIQTAVGNGEQFTATTQDRSSLMNQVFSATKMESVWGIAMSPFDALSGVGKGSDAMADLVKTSDRAVTLAERYPRLTLAGNVTPTRSRLDGSPAISVTTWSIGPALTLPLVDGSRRAANADAARAQYAAAESSFRARVRNAVREVEEAMVRLAGVAARTDNTRAAAAGYRESLEGARTRQRAGLGSLIELEDARRTSFAADGAVAALEYEGVGAWIALYRAVGGGWDGNLDPGAVPGVHLRMDTNLTRATP